MTEAMLRLFDEVILLEHRLVQVVESIHGRGGLAASGRAVLTYLRANGPTTVPDIARDRLVTRQHIQTIVDGLVARELVATTPNPAHRRSVLIALTSAGASLIDTMHERERAVLGARFQESELAAAEITAAADLLRTIRHLVAMEDPS